MAGVSLQQMIGVLDLRSWLTQRIPTMQHTSNGKWLRREKWDVSYLWLPERNFSILPKWDLGFRTNKENREI